MRSRVLSQSAFFLLTAWAAGLAAGTDLQFRHHFIDRTLPVSNASVGVDVRPLAAKPRGTVEVWEFPTESGSPVRVTVRH